MKSIIMDASVILKWFFKENHQEYAWRYLENSALQLLAPDFAFVECAGVIRRKIASNEVTLEQGKKSLQKMREIARLEFIPILNLTHQAFEIANEIQHDLYDCIYLALAIHQQSVMVTADKKFYDCVQKHDVYKDFIQWIEDELKIMK